MKGRNSWLKTEKAVDKIGNRLMNEVEEKPTDVTREG